MYIYIYMHIYIHECAYIYTHVYMYNCVCVVFVCLCYVHFARFTISNVTLAVAVPSEVSGEGKSVEASGFSFLNHVLNKSAVLPYIELEYFGTSVPAQEDIRVHLI